MSTSWGDMLRIPKKPLAWMPFPRGLSHDEKEMFKRVFEEKIMNLNLNPYDYSSDFREYCLDWSFDDWNSAKKCLREVIKAIKSGEIFYMRAGKMDPPCKPPNRKLYYEKHVFGGKIERAKAIAHFAANVLSNARFNNQKPKIEDLLENLEIVEVFDVTKEEIRNAVMEAYNRKDLVYTTIALEEIEKFLEIIC